MIKIKKNHNRNIRSPTLTYYNTRTVIPHFIALVAVLILRAALKSLLSEYKIIKGYIGKLLPRQIYLEAKIISEEASKAHDEGLNVRMLVSSLRFIMTP
jgi:hypothetical protein